MHEALPLHAPLHAPQGYSYSRGIHDLQPPPVLAGAGAKPRLCRAGPRPPAPRSCCTTGAQRRCRQLRRAARGAWRAACCSPATAKCAGWAQGAARRRRRAGSACWSAHAESASSGHGSGHAHTPPPPSRACPHTLEWLAAAVLVAEHLTALRAGARHPRGGEQLSVPRIIRRPSGGSGRRRAASPMSCARPGGRSGTTRRTQTALRSSTRSSMTAAAWRRCCTFTTRTAATTGAAWARRVGRWHRTGARVLSR
ncbi:MAG: hypothetical protein J3K34DRAFT_236200 [Monoraphidium minutum]|nr:MAG: hypothetical protein J3K34DRAFT_236200 [Monoraphidium minutum]